MRQYICTSSFATGLLTVLFGVYDSSYKLSQRGGARTTYILLRLLPMNGQHGVGEDNHEQAPGEKKVVDGRERERSVPRKRRKLWLAASLRSGGGEERGSCLAGSRMREAPGEARGTFGLREEEPCAERLIEGRRKRRKRTRENCSCLSSLQLGEGEKKKKQFGRPFFFLAPSDPIQDNIDKFEAASIFGTIIVQVLTSVPNNVLVSLSLILPLSPPPPPPPPPPPLKLNEESW